MGLHKEATDVTKEDLTDSFPTEDVLIKWSRGEEADWPPLDDEYYEEEEEDEQSEVPHLRFEVGQAVECRVGPDPVTGWAKGEITQLWYREPGWPPNSWAPYKVTLSNGKKIFAPADLEHVVRAVESPRNR